MQHIYQITHQQFHQFDDLPIHIYAEEIQGNILYVNVQEAHLFGIENINELVGIEMKKVISHNAYMQICHNNKLVEKFKKPLIFEETIHNSNVTHHGLNIKIPLYLQKKLVGIYGFAFPFNKIQLEIIFQELGTNNHYLNSIKNIMKEYLYYHQINGLLIKGREAEVLHLFCYGFSARQSGDALKISRRTVETHLENLKSKLNCGTKQDLIIQAIDSGFLSRYTQLIKIKNHLAN